MLTAEWSRTRTAFLRPRPRAAQSLLRRSVLELREILRHGRMHRLRSPQ